MDQSILINLTTYKMPFGKYKGSLICDLPEHYLIWLKNKGFPDGKLGMMLHTMYEIKLNGLEQLLHSLKSKK